MFQNSASNSFVLAGDGLRRVMITRFHAISEFIASISTEHQVEATHASIWFSNLETLSDEAFDLLELEAAEADATGSHVFFSVGGFLLRSLRCRRKFTSK